LKLKRLRNELQVNGGGRSRGVKRRLEQLVNALVRLNSPRIN
jgi:hypothetical protein